jgi:hypothetical protein
MEAYISDLKISPKDLMDLEKLKNAYETAIQPLMTLATNQGFSTNWTYRV